MKILVSQCGLLWGGVTVQAWGEHSSFPAWELIVNGKVDYYSPANGGGPGVWNIALSYVRFNTSAKVDSSGGAVIGPPER